MARRRTGARGARRRAAEPAAAGAAAPAEAAVVAVPAATAPSAAAPDSCRLQGALQIREVSERKAQLCAALGRGATRIELAGITAVDTAGVQLLVAAAQEAARRQRPLRLIECPPPVVEAVRSLGLAALLEPLMVGPA